MMMCGENFIPVVPEETMCGNCVAERKNLWVSKTTTPSLTSNAPQVYRKGEGSDSSVVPNSSPKAKRRDIMDDQKGTPLSSCSWMVFGGSFSIGVCEQ
jgi:hypothetical protein